MAVRPGRLRRPRQRPRPLEVVLMMENIALSCAAMFVAVTVEIDRPAVPYLLTALLQTVG